MVFDTVVSLVCSLSRRAVLFLCAHCCVDKRGMAMVAIKKRKVEKEKKQRQRHIQIQRERVNLINFFERGLCPLSNLPPAQ